MPLLSLKPTQKTVLAYYSTLHQYGQLNIDYESAVQTAFQHVLEDCAAKFRWVLVPQYPFKGPKGNALRADGALRTHWNTTMGIWEAKDDADDLPKEVKRKFEAGYPRKNILFQAPSRAILYQHDKQVLDEDITKPARLVEVVKQFFEYTEPAFDEWTQAVPAFADKVPELATGLIALIEKERRQNKMFIGAFTRFMETCRQSINPNLTESAVEKMLVQHLLTERIFRKVFDNSDFANKNVIAHEIEQVIGALTSNSFSRQSFSASLDYIYRPLENVASTIEDFHEKQDFLNTVYERFFQSFDRKVADTHGIVYTPQPIVKFMVNSVEDILQKEFGKSLSDKGVHILDPFVGTGNFIVQVMQAIKKSALQYKYEHELHCNEVMLLPYYIASMNIEHEFTELTGKYIPFDGSCLVDTFELAEERQQSMFSMENSRRVEEQKKAPIFVAIGNPPYNAWQIDENDNNRNRKYAALERRISETYARDSSATLLNSLADPYIKALRWATDRIGDEGIVAFVTNSGFVEGHACDGVRKHLAEDFSSIYVVDLGGNVRKNPKLSGTTHNVFGIQVGVSINFLIRHRMRKGSTATIKYLATDPSWRKEQKLAMLQSTGSVANAEWVSLRPDASHRWLTGDLMESFSKFMPIGSKTSSQTIFSAYSNGVKTNNDAYVYSFSRAHLESMAAGMASAYNSELDRWRRGGRPANVDDFLEVDTTKLKWIRHTKRFLARGVDAQFKASAIRTALYRPFCKQFLFLDAMFNEDLYGIPAFFPAAQANIAIQIKIGPEVPMFCLATDALPDLLPQGGSQVFPYYSCDVNSNRRDNITDWALGEFRTRYKDDSISKWDIFHYVYAVLHHPVYRTRYAANLKRELPRVPFAPDFHGFARAGKRLAELHVEYEKQAEYPLVRSENGKVPLSYRVEKMKLSKDKSTLFYNEFFTLSGIPPEVHEYRLGNRSALEWIVDQYQVFTDPRSGITNDPNRLDDEEYILRLIGQVVTVSIETVHIVNALPDLGLEAMPSEEAAANAPVSTPEPSEQPVAAAPEPPQGKRRFGRYRGQMRVSDDFDAPVEGLAELFEGAGLTARDPGAIGSEQPPHDQPPNSKPARKKKAGP